MVLVDLERRGQEALHYVGIRSEIQKNAAGDHALDQWQHCGEF
jgi:hypothetical protein